jgi:MYXO-CTERM domain-containing protein
MSQNAHFPDLTPMVGAIVWLVVLLAVGLLFARQRRRRGRLGAGGYGSVYDLLNQDKRQAIEIVVEGRAEARDPEDRDGNLPDLENPQRK